jgi:hypothetical protein
MPYYAETGRSCPLNSLTLRITLVSDLFLGGEYFGKGIFHSKFPFFGGKKLIKKEKKYLKMIKNWHNLSAI